MAATIASAARSRAKPSERSAMLPNTAKPQSKYKPEYCGIVESLGKQGKSLSEMALVLNVDRNSLYEWEGVHEDFGRSLARARTWSQAWWEGKAHKSLGRKHFQAQLWRYSMAGRFKEDYAEERNLNVSINLEQLVRDSLPGDSAKLVGATALPSLGKAQDKKE